MKLIQFAGLLVLSSSITVTKSEDQSSDNRKDCDIPEVVGVWRSPRTTLSIHPDRRFELDGGAKVEFGIWEESRDGGFYLRYRARNAGESGLSRAGHFVFEDGYIVFKHDDEVERFVKIEELAAAERDEFGVPGGPTLPIGKIKLTDDFSKRVALLLKDFEKLKPGMSREEIRQLFRRDGGIHRVSKERFVHPECPYFKVDVEFEFKLDPNDQNRPVRGDEDRAKKISKPYIEGIILD